MAIRIAVIPNAEDLTVVLRILAPRSVAPRNVVVPNVVLRIVALRIVVIQNVMAETAAARSVLSAVIQFAVLVVAAIQASTPAHAARNVDFHEAFREEFHVAVPTPAPVVRCVARVH